ncbi:MAG TPA: MBL fold metallo-hydrolase, partial [Thermoanaerobaculia bacterium]|nr:MBL fold metallo-hydrolase [Thermoanaerobaculia bacterium]
MRATTALLLLSAAIQLAPGVTLIPGGFRPGDQPDGNTVVFRGKGGLLVFDTGRHVEHTRQIVDFAKQSRLPVTAIVNSHWHLDHIGGNALLRREYPGVKIYASAALAEARKGFLASYHKQLEELVAQEKDAKQKEAWQAELALIDAGDRLV